MTDKRLTAAIIAAAAALLWLSASAASAAPKGYILAEIAVTNPEPYKDYVAAVTPIVAAFGGKYIVRAGRNETREGAGPQGRLVLLEFPSFEAARIFYDSPEYAAILRLRTDNATSRIILLEGYAP